MKILTKTTGIYILIFSILALQLSNLNSQVKQTSGFNKIIIKCISDNDCQNTKYNCVDKICEYKSIFRKFGVLDLAGMILICIVSIAGCIAGIGGGVFNVPIGLLFFQMDAHDVVPFSIAVVTGLMIYRVSVQIMSKQMHPFKQQSIINYDIACLFQPSICVGTQIGVIVNKVLPQWLILLCFVILMVYSFHTTKQKYQMQKDKESSTQQKLISNEIKQSEMQQTLKKQIDSKVEMPMTVEEATRKQKIEQLLQKDTRTIKWDRVHYIILSISTYFAIELFKGSGNIPSILSIEACSWQWWLFSILFIPFGILYVVLIQRQYLKEYQEKIELNIEIDQNDFKWNKEFLIRLNKLGILVGILSSMLGIGGGIVIAPLLLQIGLEPAESSATTSFITLFTSLTNLLKYVLVGSIVWDYAIFAGAVGVIGFYIGLKCMTWITKNNKQSLIILMLLVIFVVVSILVTFTGVQRTIEGYRKGQNVFEFKSVCTLKV